MKNSIRDPRRLENIPCAWSSTLLAWNSEFARAASLWNVKRSVHRYCGTNLEQEERWRYTYRKVGVTSHPSYQPATLDE